MTNTEKVFLGIQPEEVMQDLIYLNERGFWRDGKQPKWVGIYQEIHDVQCTTPWMLLFAYEWLLNYFYSNWQKG